MFEFVSNKTRKVVDKLYISGRERKIIDFLLAEQDELPIKQLADNMGVSSRTIHRDLRGVEDILHGHALTLEKKSGVGIRVQGAEQDKRKLQITIASNVQTDFTPEDRQALILSKLLETTEPIKLVGLANDLNVTIATISNDLDRIENYLDEFDLSLIRKRGYGVEIKGNESNKREVLSHLILQNMDEFDFISLLKENIEKKSLHAVPTVSDQLLGMVDRDKLLAIEKVVESFRGTLPYDLADSAYMALVIHLALAIERLQQGGEIQISPEYLDNLRETKEFAISQNLTKELENLFNLAIPEHEVGYITMHLMGAKIRYDRDFLLEDTSMQTAFKAKQLIDYVSGRLNKDLHQPSRLLNDLVAHLRPTMYRLNQKMDIVNPLLGQLEHDYPELFVILEDAVEHTFPEITVPRDEVGFLVMHFASALLNLEGNQALSALVICSSGIGTAKMLAAKLQQEFPEIEYVHNSSLFELKDIDVNAFDLVVSTIPLKDFNSEYVHVNPMLPNKEVHRLQHVIKRYRITHEIKDAVQINKQALEDASDIRNRVERVQHYAAAIAHLLKGMAVTQIDGNTIQKVLSQACYQLFENGIIEDKAEVLNELLRREQAGGLGIPNTILALYHTRNRQITVPSFTVYPLSNPIAVKGMEQDEIVVETVLLMLAPEVIDSEAMEVLSFISSLLIDDKESIYVLESKQEQTIVHYISNQLNTFLKEKINN